MQWNPVDSRECWTESSKKFVIQNFNNNRRRNFYPGVKNNKNSIRNLRATRTGTECARRPMKSTCRTN